MSPLRTAARVIVLGVGLGAGACTFQNPDFDGDGSASAGSEASTSAAIVTAAGTMSDGSASASTAASASGTSTAATTTATTSAGATTSASTEATRTDTSLSETGDVTTTTTTGEDAPPGACGVPAEKWHFDEVGPIAAIQTLEYEGDPLLLADQKTLYYTAYAGVAESDDIFVATRAGFGEPFVAQGQATALGLNTPAVDSRIALSVDLLRVYFATIRPRGPGGVDVWFASRPLESVPFGPAAPIPVINNSKDDYDPFISEDELRLYFGPKLDGSHEIAVATRPTIDAPFGEPIPIPGINDPSADEANPSLTRDERVLLFVSNRAGNGDIYVTTRPTIDAPFGAVTILGPEINSVGGLEGEPFLAESDDGCELFFVSTAAGNWDIYRARLIP